MKKKIALFAVIIMVAACKKSSAPAPVIYKSTTQGLITDISSIKIGTQKWKTTNLAVGRYRNGDRIPQVKGGAAWSALTTGAWCWYNNDSATGAVYGKLYNWYAVNDPRGLAPAGWHVPSVDEWDALRDFLGGYAVAGGKMKETGTTHWLDPNWDATNSTGFTGLPGGCRNWDGTFGFIGNFGYWWSSTQNGTLAWNRGLGYSNDDLSWNAVGLQSGLSVRCVRD